jgi:hypothetical protein
MSSALNPLNSPLNEYQGRLARARRRIKDRPELQRLMSADAKAELLHAFLIQWAALSVQLQEPAERFMVEASRRCSEVGEHRLALAFLQIAGEAIDRYRLVANDTRTLAQLWNRRYAGQPGQSEPTIEPTIELTQLLTQPSTSAMKQLHAHHQGLVSSSQPWLQLAAIYEADAMLGTVVERVTQQARRLLGDEVRGCLRSLDAIAHFGERSSLAPTMIAFLDTNPERVDPMAATAERTLEIYGEFLIECCVVASNSSRRLSPDPDRARAG